MTIERGLALLPPRAYVLAIPKGGWEGGSTARKMIIESASGRDFEKRTVRMRAPALVALLQAHAVRRALLAR